MRVIVCGGRNFDDGARLREVLNSMHENLGPITVLAHGAATGADMLADTWARHKRGIVVEMFHADWRAHGKAAGPIRNQQMLDGIKPDLVIAFPGGKGTAHMVKIAKAQGFNVVEPVVLHPPQNGEGTK